LAVLLFAAIASILDPVPPNRATAQATVRIVQSVDASKKEWEKLQPSRRREIVVVEGGRRITVRVVEME
jgi:hypothetical protein